MQRKHLPIKFIVLLCVIGLMKRWNTNFIFARKKRPARIENLKIEQEGEQIPSDEESGKGGGPEPESAGEEEKKEDLESALEPITKELEGEELETEEEGKGESVKPKEKEGEEKEGEEEKKKEEKKEEKGKEKEKEKGEEKQEEKKGEKEGKAKGEEKKKEGQEPTKQAEKEKTPTSHTYETIPVEVRYRNAVEEPEKCEGWWQKWKNWVYGGLIFVFVVIVVLTIFRVLGKRGST